MKDIFISFSSKNMDEANRICDLLESNGYSCFIATRDIIPGQEYASQLVDEMDGARVLVLLLSEESNESPHVLREIEYCVSHKFPIIVYPIEKVNLTKSMEYFLMTHQWLNLDDNKDVKLLECLNAHFERENPQAVEAGSKTETLEEAAIKDAAEYAQMLKKTRRTYGKAFLLMIIVVVLLFTAMFAKYVLPYMKGQDDKKTETAVSASTSAPEVSQNLVKLGDRISLGKYNGKAIEWRVIHINDDNTAVLLSSEILTIKAFDTAEGGEYNEYEGVDYWEYENRIIDDPYISIMARGNNDWSKSNIRTWLNSDCELVEYADQAPTRKASCTGENYYSNEHGFLYDFTAREREAIVVTHNRTIGNEFSENAVDGMVETDDLVYLLSEDELSYLKEAGISMYATVTSEATEGDTSHSVSSFTQNYRIDNYYWWLRDHNSDAKTNEGKIVLTEYEGEDKLVESWSVGAASYGIRPAVTVEISKIKYMNNVFGF